MKKLIRLYEKDIKALERRITELTSLEQTSELRDRIELLQTERLELMYSAAMMRRRLAPPPALPSLRYSKAKGDAVC